MNNRFLNKGISTPIAIIIIVILAALAGGLVWQYKKIEGPEGPGVPEGPEKINRVLITHTSGGMGGGSTEWIKISRKENNWKMERCSSSYGFRRERVEPIPEEKEILCGSKKIEKDSVEKILEGVKNTPVSEPTAPPTDVYSSYEVSINTSYRQIWAKTSMGEPWKVISQSSDQRELFQMKGEKITKAISDLPSVKKEEQKEKIEWEISKPSSLLNRFLPRKLDNFNVTERELLSFEGAYTDQGEKFGIIDFASKGWTKENFKKTFKPTFQALVLAFQDASSMSKFQNKIFQYYSPDYSSEILAMETEEIEVEGVKGKEYIFETKERSGVLAGLAKDNLLIMVIGRDDERPVIKANVETLAQDLKLEKEVPQYIVEGEEVEFEGTLEMPTQSKPGKSRVERCLELQSKAEKHKCIGKIALSTGNKDICQVYQKPEFGQVSDKKRLIEECYLSAAVGQEDPSVCDELETYSKSRCLDTYYWGLALEKSDSSICEKINKEEIYQRCIKDLE